MKKGAKIPCFFNEITTTSLSSLGNTLAVKIIIILMMSLDIKALKRGEKLEEILIVIIMKGRK